jgi:hypothetical protein
MRKRGYAIRVMRKGSEEGKKKKTKKKQKVQEQGIEMESSNLSFNFGQDSAGLRPWLGTERESSGIATATCTVAGMSPRYEREVKGLNPKTGWDHRAMWWLWAIEAGSQSRLCSSQYNSIQNSHGHDQYDTRSSSS